MCNRDDGKQYIDAYHRPSTIGLTASLLYSNKILQLKWPKTIAGAYLRQYLLKLRREP